MESIKFNDKGHSIAFSKRSLTIDNKEYLYTGISSIKHSSAYHAYLFRYQGEWVKLFYEEPHGETIAALFKKINLMNARRAAKARATQSIDTSAIAAALAAANKTPAEETPAEVPAEAPAEEVPVAEVPAEEAPAEEVPAAEAPVAETPAEEVPEVEAPVAETPAEEVPDTETPVVEVPEVEVPVVEEPASEPAAEETPAVATPAVKVPEIVVPEIEVPSVGTQTEESKSDDQSEAVIAEAQAEADKRAKRKKAFIIFAIILALFIIAGIIYFFTVGTTSDSSQSPNVDETHQYNDIDELIEEMQE